MGRIRPTGFSLFELLLVLTVLGLAAGLSYPALSRGASALRLRATGRDLLNCLRYAREKAITEQVGMRVVVNRETQEVIVTDAYGEGSRKYPLSQDVKIASMAFAGKEVLEGPMVIRFLPNGSSENAVILLRSKTGGIMRILTDPITGGVRALSEPVGRNR